MVHDYCEFMASHEVILPPHECLEDSKSLEFIGKIPALCVGELLGHERCGSACLPCLIRAPMPVGHASVMTQTLSLALSLLERFSGGFHWIGFRIGVLHVRHLILLKHFWWSGVHLNCCLFVQMVCSGLV